MDIFGTFLVPKIQHRYKHMMPEDTIIWRKFIANGQYLPEKVWYDVRVGQAVEVPSGQPDWMKKFSEYSTRKRIDMVWRTGMQTWIVEAKPRAGMVALGQVIYYTTAFNAEYRPDFPAAGAILTDIVDEDVKSLFDLWGIVVFEVGI